MQITHGSVHFWLTEVTHHNNSWYQHSIHTVALIETWEWMSIQYMWGLYLKKEHQLQMYNMWKTHPSSVFGVACHCSNSVHESRWQTANQHRHSGQRSWRRLDSKCANQRRPACRLEPISAFQRAAAQPIAGLHDRKEVTAYIWREHNSFNIISQRKEYRKGKLEKQTLQEEAHTSWGNVKALNSPIILR